MESFIDKVNSIIERLINREGVLIVVEDSEESKLLRELQLNINYRT